MRSLITPHSPEIEIAVIGQLILEPELIKTAELNERDFHGGSCRRIFKVMQDLSHNGEGFDLPSLAGSLSREDFEVLNDASGEAFTIANFSSHVSRLKKDSAKRRIQAICLEVAEKIPETEIEAISSKLKQAISEMPTSEGSLENIILPVEDFDALEVPDRIDHLSPWLKEDSINLVAGWRGIGKTFFSWGLADALSRGSDFGPWKCANPVPVLILDGEMPIKDLKKRIKLMSLATDRPCPLYFYSDALANQRGLPRAHLADESWREKMKLILLQQHVRVWIIDNLSSLASGLDENLKQDWDRVNDWLLELRFQGVSTILLHHLGKEGTQRGTSSREDHLDTSIILKRPADYHPEEGCRFIVTFTKTRVPLENLPLISEVEFKLQQDEGGRYMWGWSNLKRKTRDEILRMLDEGISQVEIAKALGIDKGYVSRIRKKAMDENILGKNGKLTQSGFTQINAVDQEPS